MEKKDPSKDILNKIKKEHITPKSYFQTHWKNYVFWIMWGLIMFFGAISFSLLLLNIMDIRPTFLRELGIGHYLRLLVDTAPYLWLVLVLVAFGAGYMAMRRTRTGYRYSILFITSSIVLIISMIGALFHISKFNQHVGERMMHDQRMSDMGFPARERMSRPEDGVLGGRIIEISQDQIEIKNLKDINWSITYDSNTKIDLKEDLEVGIFVMFIGKKNERGIFHADIIQPLPLHFKDGRNMKNKREFLQEGDRFSE